MQISLLPLDLARWDQAPGGDLFAVPVWTDVRPLRGAAGLLDWRLNGQLSECLLAERFQGQPGEKLLLPTRRIRWRAILAVGAGAAAACDERGVGAWLETVFAAAAGLGLRSAAVALPGRERDRITPDRALAVLRQTADVCSLPTQITDLAVVDTPAAVKVMAEILRPPTAATAPPPMVPGRRGR